MREEPVNVFDSGHISIDNIKSVYISAAISSELRHLERTPGIERELPTQEGAAGSVPVRFGGTRTRIHARNSPAWWYGGPPLELGNKNAAYYLIPEPDFQAQRERAIRVPDAPKLGGMPWGLEAKLDTGDRPQRPSFVKRGIAPKLTQVQHAMFRASSDAPLGIAHNLPSEQGGFEWFPRRPEPGEYEHGRQLQLARGVRLRGMVELPAVDASTIARKVPLISAEDRRVLGPDPRTDVYVHESVRRRMPKPPTAKITGEHDLSGPRAKRIESVGALGTPSSGGYEQADDEIRPKSRPAPWERPSGAPLGRTALRVATASFANPSERRADSGPSLELPKSKPIVHAGEDSHQTYNFGDGPATDRLAFDPTYSGAHALKDTAVTYNFGEMGAEDKHHTADYTNVYSTKHVTKDTKSQVHFGDYVGPLGRSSLW